MPDNFVDLTINLGPPVSRQLIGFLRSRTLQTGEIILSNCRSKGLTLQAEEFHLISAKIPAHYTRLFFNDENTMERDQTISLGIFPEIQTSEQFEQHLSQWFKNLPHFEPSFLVDEATHIIRKSQGDIKIKEVIEQLGISKSHLEQRFSYEIGLSPKEFCKIEKLKYFLANYSQYQDSMNLTQLAFKSGYYDQSHLVKEFRYFMDVRPREFLCMAGLTF